MPVIADFLLTRIVARKRIAVSSLFFILTTCTGLSALAWLTALPGKSLILGMLLAGFLTLLRIPVVACLLISMSWVCWQGHQVFNAIPSDYVNESVELVGQITGMPEQNGDVQQFVLNTQQPDWLQGKRIKISWYRTAQEFQQQPIQVVQAGEKWRLSGRLKPVYGAVNPHGFDYARWLLSKRISGTLSVQQGMRLSQARRTVVDHWRERLSGWIKQTMTAENASTASALSIGDKSAIDDHQRKVLQRTGTGHLLAISGLHVGMVGMLGWLLGRLLCAVPQLVIKAHFRQSAIYRYSGDIAQYLPLFLSALLAVSYAVMSGFVVSTGRALLMLLIAGLAVVLRRRLLTLHLLLAALLLSLLVNPLMVLGAGFWLSFSAVAWLYWAFHGRNSRLPQWQSMIRAQLVLMLAMLPLQLVWFQQLSFVALPANLVAVPLVSLVILPILLIAVLLHIALLPGADSILLLAGMLLTVLQQFLEWLSSFNHAAMDLIPGSAWWQLLLAVAGAVWLLAPKGIPIRFAGCLLMLPLLIPVDDKPLYGHWEMQVFDVGQGLAIAVRTQQHVLIYDTGPGDGQGRDRVRSAMLPVLRRWGGKVNHLLISHGDLDHAGGYQTAVSELDIKTITSSKISLGQRCHDVQSWHWDGVSFQMLHPGEFLPYLGNDSSCVLYIESEQGSVLLPGDISKAAEQRLLNLYNGPSATVLVVGHHGSKSSSSSEWLAAVSPQLALVSAGQWNRFGMPHLEVVERFAGAGIPLLNTAVCGALNLRTDHSEWPKAVPVRAQYRRWWITASDCAVQY